MRWQRLLPIAGAFAVATALLSCVTPSMNTPEGFARYGGSLPLAVSPEGVLVRARLVDNRPSQNLEFWAEALKRQLEASGYFLVQESGFESDAGPGTLFEWAAPVYGEDWIYLTAIVVAGDKIALVESAGAFEHYQRYRTAIRESLSTLQVSAGQ